jgi:glutamyl-tRNA synthetase
MKELVDLFTIERVNSSPARFDMKKLEAINGDKIRALSIEEFLKRALPYLLKEGVIKGEASEVKVVRDALPIIQERIARMKEVVPMLRFLFVEEISFDQESAAKLAESDSQKVINTAISALEPVSNWQHEAIEGALRNALIDGLGLKPRNAFGPVRIAVTGSHISPPLFESMELLGRDRSMARLKSAVR